MDAAKQRLKEARAKMFQEYCDHADRLMGGLKAAFARGLIGAPNRYIRGSAAALAWRAGCASRSKYRVVYEKIKPYQIACIERIDSEPSVR